MSQGLPDSWLSTGFLNIFDVQGGTQPPKSEFIYEARTGYVQLLQIRDFGERSVPTFIPDTMKLKKCAESDILIARYGASLGRILTGMSGAYNVAMAKVAIPELMDRRFVYHLLKAECFQAPLRLVSRSAQNGFNKEDLSNFVLPLAPLPEQKRIADKLDSVLARVDACRDRLDRLPALLKRFRQSILAAATSGRLTEDWRSYHRTAGDARALLSLIQKEKLEKSKEYFFRKQPLVNAFDADEAPFELPSTWVWARSSQLFLKITDGAHNTPKVLTEGCPYLTSKDIATGRLDFSSKQFISEQDHRELYSKCRPEPGDLLITNIGASSGCSALVDTAMEFSFKNIAILKPSRHLESKYLWFHQNARRDSIFSELTRGGAQPFLSLAILGNLFFALPPLPEQTEIVRRVEILFAFADRLETRLATARRQVGQLTPALLAKAFRGELVAQDPADEPAAELLKRLAAQREVAPKVKRGRAKA